MEKYASLRTDPRMADPASPNPQALVEAIPDLVEYGSGMFIDLAHLVRTTADRHGQEARIHGFVVMPQAFNGHVSDPIARSRMLASGFASLRELTRFSADYSWANGYPMHYQCNGADGLTRSAVRATLFDRVYCVEGNQAMVDVIQGIEIDRGFVSDAFVTNPRAAECTLDEPLILLCEYKLTAMREILPLLVGKYFHPHE